VAPSRSLGYSESWTISMSERMRWIEQRPPGWLKPGAYPQAPSAIAAE
jgi:hypothetical protein